jgi:hypothetical protein
VAHPTTTSDIVAGKSYNLRGCKVRQRSKSQDNLDEARDFDDDTTHGTPSAGAVRLWRAPSSSR